MTGVTVEVTRTGSTDSIVERVIKGSIDLAKKLECEMAVFVLKIDDSSEDDGVVMAKSTMGFWMTEVGRPAFVKALLSDEEIVSLLIDALKSKDKVKS